MRTVPLFLVLATTAALAMAQPTTRVSLDSAGQQVQGLVGSFIPTITPDGRYISFTSSVNALLPTTDDAPQPFRAYRLDTTTGEFIMPAVNSAGSFANGFAGLGSMSADGSIIAFVAAANNLVPGDTNAQWDVFVRDVAAATTTRVSVGPGGLQGNGLSTDPSISADGRFIAYIGESTNLGFPGTACGGTKVFVYDRIGGAVTHESVALGGGDACGSHYPSISGDGSFVVFSSDAANLVPGDTNNAQDLFLRDRNAATTTRIAQRVAASTNSECQASISADGRFIAFTAPAPASDSRDAYIYDRIGATTTRISDALPNGPSGHTCDHAANISANGRFVTFTARTNGPPDGVWETFLYDRVTTALTQTSVHLPGGSAGEGSGDIGNATDSGQVVVFSSASDNLVPGDTNGEPDVFLRDLAAASTRRINVTPEGEASSIGGAGSRSSSGDGRFIAMLSNASITPEDSNFTWDAYVKDLSTGQVSRISASTTGGDADVGVVVTSFPQVSQNGLFAAFASDSTNLVNSDTNGATDVFVRDLALNQNELVSVATAGTQGNGPSHGPALSADAALIAFVSTANNLVPGDTNNLADIFVRDRAGNTTQRVSVGSAAVQANGDSDTPAISADGRYIVFASDADNLAPGDSGGYPNIFRHDRQTQSTIRVSVDQSGQAAQGECEEPCTSADGTIICFLSNANNLSPGGPVNSTGVFVRDAAGGTTQRVDIAIGGAEPNGGAGNTAISANGRYIMFSSRADNLVVGDTNNEADLFVFDRSTNQTVRVNLTTAGGQVSEPTHDRPQGCLTADGSTAVFFSRAGDLVPGDTNNQYDTFTRLLAPPPPPCGTADFDGDGDTGTDLDIEAFFACLGGNCCATCFPGGADFNGDGDTGTDLDIEAFFRVLGGLPC